MSCFFFQNPSIAQETNYRQLKKIPFKNINFVGNTVFSNSELREVIPVPTESISLEHLYYLASLIRDYYQDEGYKGSEAQVNVQRISDGEVLIAIVEPTLEDLDIRGLKSLNTKYITNRLPKSGKPLNIYEWEKALSRLEQNSAIKEINNIQLNRLDNGRFRISLDILEESSLESRYVVTNGFSPSIGSLGGIASVGYRLSGVGDSIGLDYSRTEGLNSWSLGYNRPIDSSDGSLALRYTRANASFVEDELAPLDIQADVSSYQLKLTKSIFNSKYNNFLAGFVFDVIDSESFLDRDFSFAFIESLEDGKSQVRAFRIIQQFVNQGQNTVLVASSQFSLGLDVLNPTITETGQDALFWSWQGELSFVRRISELQLKTDFNIQLTPDRLLPVEQISIGGFDSVRAFRQNLTIGDNGFNGSLELAYPFYQQGTSKFSLIPFFDIGQVWNNDEVTVMSDFLASVGVGLSYQLGDRLKAQIDYGFPLVEVEDEQNINFLLFLKP